MEVLLLLIMALANIACFVIGAKVGQAVSKGEKIELPPVNPVKAVMARVVEQREQREAQKEQEKIDTILRNIESYDGTAKGQEDVPRG